MAGPGICIVLGGWIPAHLRYVFVYSRYPHPDLFVVVGLVKWFYVSLY